MFLGLQFTMDEEREEGGSPPKSTLSGEHGRQSKDKRYNRKISNCL